MIHGPYVRIMTSSGLDGVVAAATAISHVDGERGELVVAGYPIEELAEHATFEEVTWLLWHGDLPSARHAYAEALRHRRTASVAAKYLLACSGRAGQVARAGLIRVRQLVRHMGSSAVRA